MRPKTKQQKIVIENSYILYGTQIQVIGRMQIFAEYT